jgi:hypothetical protein
MSTGNDLSLVVPVFEAVGLQAFRDKHLHRPAVVMPPHVTVPSPFKSYDEIDQRVMAVLTATVSTLPQFRFALDALERFREPGVLYLKPEPVEPFMRLHQRICDAFVADSSKSVVFHLTLAGWHAASELDTITAEFLQEHGWRLPIEATAREVWLYEQVGGTWLHRASFGLGPAQAGV